MTITIKHAKTSSVPDDPAAVAAGDVVPSDWNADHTVIGSIGIPDPLETVALYDKGGEVFDAVAYGWLPDGTDHSTEALALLTTVAAAGGGTIYFPPSAGKYRADSQLFIPNDAVTIPNQVNIRFTGAGGGAIWGDIARDSIGASVLDLRYHANDGNAKIESRGAGSLLIDNLTLMDGSASNATPFIHSTNTTLTIRGNTFLGTGNAGQDAIVLGGPTLVTPDGTVGSIFQGYGTVIDANQFRKLNRGVFGRTASNSVIVTNNSWLASTGTRAIEFSSSTGNPPDIITSLFVTGNVIEMSAPMIYGVYLAGVRESYFVNNFNDPGINYVSDYHLAAVPGICSGNVIVNCLSGGVTLTQSGDVTQLTQVTHIGADGSANFHADGISSSLFSKGVEIGGSWTPTNAAAGALNIRDEFNPEKLLCLAISGGVVNKAFIDAWSSAGSNQQLDMQPRGGPLTVGTFALRPSALSLANGTNSNIGLWQADDTHKNSYLRITGPTGAFTITGISNASSGTDSIPGSILILYNSTAQQMTLVNDATSSVNNRILTLTGADVVLASGPSSATFIYDGTDLRWILLSVAP